ncbi:hypothetical protein N658DRAFT_485451 [Parathielavia hyrcaniae]|uniref:Uncharacterized protein n=1 Tax=Parathielavia hyrcaniae TaxID=113614 RepID=A0AAN6Q4F2_9PEZI|nr:hypothetical protein N658DRAFT_485451 [Parathielavia hyrcaniae]
MSCSEAGNAVGGIRVRRDTQVTVEDCRDSVERRRHPPFTTTIRSAGLGEHTTPWQQQRSSRANASPAASGSSHPVREGLRSDALDRTMAKKREEEHTTQDLVDFLRKTSPPPGNPMSRLTLVDKRHEKKSKRFPFWPFRKRKETITTSERTSGLIKLPDSAVAGTTIGGHRYIAISIPIEHAHMSPVPRPTASSPAGRLGNDTLVGELAGDGPGARESQDWDETNYTTPARDDMRLLPCQLSNGDARQKTARPPRARFGSVSVGAHNMTPKHYMPELTAQPKGMAGVPVDVMDGMPGQSRSLCHRPVLHPVSAHEARLQDGEAIQSTDTTLLNKLESVAESSHATSSSELVCSDAETVNITSSQSTAEISPSSDESGSFHTAGPAQSPLVSPHLDSTERGDPSMQSPAASNFSALCDPSTSQTSSPSELAFPQRILFSHGFHQPHALSAITSVDSLSLSTPQDARSPSMAPFVPLAEHQPSRTSLRQISGTLTPLSPPIEDSHRALLCRYEALSQTRALELEGMLDRLERLESAHKRWMAALEPRGVVVWREFAVAVASAGEGVAEEWEGEGEEESGGGGGDYLDGVGVGGEGSAGRRDERRIIAHTGRFEFDSVDAARDMRSTADGRDGAVGDDDGQVDANDQSWLPRESGSATWLVSGSGELVLKSHGRALRRLEMRDGLDGSVWGSTKNLRVGQGSWRRATSAGRQAEAFARDQRRWRRRAALSGRDGGQRTCRIEDPSGYNGLETVMRDLVLASRDADESAKVSSA